MHLYNRFFKYVYHINKSLTVNCSLCNCVKAVLRLVLLLVVYINRIQQEVNCKGKRGRKKLFVIEVTLKITMHKTLNLSILIHRKSFN